MVDVNIKIIPLLVFSGKDQDISLRQYSEKPESPPDDRALQVFEPTRIEFFTKLFGLYKAKEEIAFAADPPNKVECEVLLNGKLEDALPGYKAGPALVMARSTQDGRWVPPQNPPPPGTELFPFAFLLRSKNNNEDYYIDLPVRNTVVRARVLILIQRAD